MKKGSTKGVKGKVQQVKLPGPHPTVQKARALNQALEDLRTKYGDDMVDLAVYGDGLHGDVTEKKGDQKPGASHFPVRLYPKNDYDQVMQVKTWASDSKSGMQSWNKDFTTQDAQWILDKQRAETQASFKAWLSQMYDPRDPSQAEMLDRVFPELQQEREAIIDQRADLEKRCAKIRLRGPRDKDDIQLLFALASGAIEKPRGALWKPEDWFDAGNDRDKRLARGRFSYFNTYRAAEERKLMPFDKLMAMKPTGSQSFAQDGADKGVIKFTGFDPKTAYPV